MDVKLGAPLEGKFAIPTAKMIAKLNQLLTSEYTAWLTYTNFGFILTGPNRDSLKEILEEHAEEELEHANKLALRIKALGGTPTSKVEPVPAASTNDEILAAFVKQEQEALKLYRDALRFCGDNEGLRQNLETIIEDEQEHSDELKLLMSSEAKEEKVAEYLCSRFDKGIPLWQVSADSFMNLADAFASSDWDQALSVLRRIKSEIRNKKLKRADQTQYEIEILDENELRTVYDVSARNPEGELNSICRVLKETTDGNEVWSETCSDDGVSHIELVKEWEKAGGRSVLESDPHFKQILDTTKGKGKKPFHKNVSHKPLPKLTKPDKTKKPLQRGKDVEPKILVEDKR